MLAEETIRLADSLDLRRQQRDFTSERQNLFSI